MFFFLVTFISFELFEYFLKQKYDDIYIYLKSCLLMSVEIFLKFFSSD